MTDIENVFSIFHDGWISGYSGDMTSLNLKIECTYLAELINLNYSFFYIKLFEVSHLSFQTWPNLIDLPSELIIKPEKIFQAELEILSAHIKDDVVEVICNQYEKTFDYCGGVLRISANRIEVCDEKMNTISLNELSSISDKYWDTFR